MEIEKLENILEAILFVSGEGISLAALTESLGMQKSEMNRAVASLKEKYGGASGVRLISFAGKIQLASNPDYADSVAGVLRPMKEKELSNAALETIAIVAYRQPVTRLEIEQIRGVNCDYSVQVLLKHGLIEAVGRKGCVGKPILFGTTDAFLKRFQISSLNELPDYEDLLESIKVLNLTKSAPAAGEAAGLYNEFEIPEPDSAPPNPAVDGGRLTVDSGEADGSSSEPVGGDPSGAPQQITNADENAQSVWADGNPPESVPESRIPAPDDSFPNEEIPDFLKGEKNLQRIN
ncbi:MAG: SMC-Scp complex subunit ScpB [Firmicutes bacterium]|nr:SMC-Scp complex subunit ScpB [Bacillota bacterium]